MDFKKMSLRLPTVLIMIMGAGVFADEPGPPPPQDQQYQEPPPQYYQQSQLPAQYPAPPCGSCQPPFDPGQNYYCGPQCAPPVLPYPPQALAPYPPPIYYPPNYGGGYYPPGGYGGGYYPPIYRRPVRPIYPPNRYGPRPTPYYRGGGAYRGGHGYRRMSLTACEVQQGNNGEFSVLSSDDRVIYSDRSAHAQENAEAMKAYYEKSNTGLCTGGTGQVKTQDI